MRVAILGDRLRQPISGIGNYIVNLTANLRRLFPRDTFEVALPSRHGYALGETEAALTSPWDPSKGPGRKLWALVDAYRLLAREGFDIIHSPGTVGAFFFSRVTGPKKVLTIHDFGPITWPKTHQLATRLEFLLMMKRSAAQADGLVTDSNFVLAESHRFVPSKAHQRRTSIPLGVDEVFFRGVPQASSEPFFLVVGNLEPRKNLERVLEAFKIYRRLGGKAKLILIGPMGWRNVEIRARVDALLRQEAVVELGYVAKQDLVGWYRRAKGLLYPSLYEGFGLPVLEAMAAGCPVVASTVSSLPEVAGDAALYVDPTRTEEIAAALTTLDESNEIRNRMAANGRRHARGYPWSRTATLTHQFYLDVLATAGR